MHNNSKTSSANNDDNGISYLSDDGKHIHSLGFSVRACCFSVYFALRSTILWVAFRLHLAHKCFVVVVVVLSGSYMKEIRAFSLVASIMETAQ